MKLTKIGDTWFFHTEGTEPREEDSRDVSNWEVILIAYLQEFPAIAPEAGLFLLEAAVQGHIGTPLTPQSTLETFPTFQGCGFEIRDGKLCFGPVLKGGRMLWRRLTANFEENPNHSAIYGKHLAINGGPDPFLYSPANPDVQLRGDLRPLLRALWAITLFRLEVSN